MIVLGFNNMTEARRNMGKFKAVHKMVSIASSTATLHH
jgi:hypothetical protein